jgi:hypothetical protein
MFDLHLQTRPHFGTQRYHARAQDVLVVAEPREHPFPRLWCKSEQLQSQREFAKMQFFAKMNAGSSRKVQQAAGLVEDRTTNRPGQGEGSRVRNWPDTLRSAGSKSILLVGLGWSLFVLSFSLLNLALWTRLAWRNLRR